MKKLLAFMLATLLLLSALPLAGAAFKDDLAIDPDYKTAVEEMSQRNIINGFADGSFGPRKTLTRAQAAKILCVMLEGAEKAEALTKTETGFSDVPANNWAAKYVAYCVDKGIVAGVGDGKFDPDGKLSFAAFAKMLLVAYGADGAGFTGADWMTNVEKAAEPTILMLHITDKLNNNALQRQKAAQMAYNMLFTAEAKAAKTQKDLSGKLPTSVPEKLKVLAVGNSSSNDCMLFYLWELLKDVGVKEFTIANMYKSGCSLQMHAEFAVGKDTAYQYYKRTQSDGKWKSTKKNTQTLDVPLEDEEWDIITFQQNAAGCGHAETFEPWQELLLYYVQRKQPKAIFGWNMVWALTNGTKKESFQTYGNDQMQMYKMISDASVGNMENEKRYQFLIPVGTAIQNARTSFLGDRLDRDTAHLNKGIGRYIAAMTWCCKLTGADPDKITYLPEDLVLDKKEYSIAGLDMSNPKLLEALGKVARESVRNAIANPYEITPSQYTTAP
ncbi:MAG: DUF4886 domain-containing protein [Oscillospiraceae bacterium]|nr:DUF4886 domain-containing protein [Oscillospiraceae bacterium]MBR3850356.1 DUF4886 domain-containing protein [Oscillospiraceae bacterium]